MQLKAIKSLMLRCERAKPASLEASASAATSPSRPCFARHLRVRTILLLLQSIYPLEHVDHARDEAVAEAHVLGHDEELVHAFAQERGDR